MRLAFLRVLLFPAYLALFMRLKGVRLAGFIPIVKAMIPIAKALATSKPFA
jgi:hypothetical protein